MNPVDIIIVAVIVAILGLAGLYIYKAKKSGKKCIGCPDGASCGAKGGSACSGSCGGCSCGCGTEKK